MVSKLMSDLLHRWANGPWWLNVVVTIPAVGAFVVLGEQVVRYALGW